MENTKTRELYRFIHVQEVESENGYVADLPVKTQWYCGLMFIIIPIAAYLLQTYPPSIIILIVSILTIIFLSIVRKKLIKRFRLSSRNGPLSVETYYWNLRVKSEEFALDQIKQFEANAYQQAVYLTFMSQARVKVYQVLGNAPKTVDVWEKLVRLSAELNYFLMEHSNFSGSQIGRVYRLDTVLDDNEIQQYQERKFLKKLRILLEVSPEIEIEKIRRLLDMDKNEFEKMIRSSAEEFGFKIIDDRIIVDTRLDSFIAELDRSFKEWDEQEDRMKKND